MHNDFGAFDFNRTPLGPLGTKVIVHEKPSVHESYARHSAPGWYFGPATHHYRCYRTYITETGAERNADTLEWFPDHTPMPKTATTDAVLAAAADLTEALLKSIPPTPFPGLNPTKLASLR